MGHKNVEYTLHSTTRRRHRRRLRSRRPLALSATVPLPAAPPSAPSSSKEGVLCGRAFRVRVEFPPGPPDALLLLVAVRVYLAALLPLP